MLLNPSLGADYLYEASDWMMTLFVQKREISATGHRTLQLVTPAL